METNENHRNDMKIFSMESLVAIQNTIKSMALTPRETAPHGNSSNSAELIPTVQTFLEQYRIASHSTGILRTVQNGFPQYRDSSDSAELIPTVQKFYEQYRIASHSAEILRTVQN